MAGTYIRCDVDCNPVTPQPTEAIVSQVVSGIEYEVFNGDYIRTDKDCNPTTQPDLKNGWNGDYIRVDVDGVKTSGLSQQFVEQTIYIKSDVDCNPLPFFDYIRHDVDNQIIPLIYITPKVGGPVITALLADEDDRDNIIISENDHFRIQLEDNTVFNIQDLENIVMIDETETDLLAYEDGNLIEPNL